MRSTGVVGPGVGTMPELGEFIDAVTIGSACSTYSWSLKLIEPRRHGRLAAVGSRWFGVRTALMVEGRRSKGTKDVKLSVVGLCVGRSMSSSWLSGGLLSPCHGR